MLTNLRRLIVAIFIASSGIALAKAAGAMSVETTRVQAIMADPAFKTALATFNRDYERYVQDIILLTEIPAPPFGEKARGLAFLKLMSECGLEDVHMDEEGNVLGLKKGRGHGPLLAVAAHLDTVFPAGTDVIVKRVGTTLRAPGIGDDTQGLALMLAMLRAIHESKFETFSDILFIANVGEEGPGDLRGTRYLFSKSPYKDKIRRFITIDGFSSDIVTNGALGSFRYRVTFKGPGGHSWSAFGSVNPAFAMGNAIARLGRIKVPTQPKVSFNVGIVSGGTSVNSIPFETSMEVDMRSTSPEELKKIDNAFKQLVEASVTEENEARSTKNGALTADIKMIGERPSGINATDSAELKQVTATMKAYEKTPVWNTGSTDANIPISLGIPAFAMASHAGSRGGRSHSLDEWIDIEKGDSIKDFSLALALILSIAEMP